MNVISEEIEKNYLFAFHYSYLKHSSYEEVARWLTEYTGRKITGMGLWKRVKKDKADKQKYVKQKRYEAKTEAQGNVTTQANV